MELRHLRYFIAVAEELSFSRAAAKLRLAQPSLSAQIRSLEGELGFVLLDRSRRHVSLTDAGTIFLREAKDLLARAETAVKKARDAAHGTVGELRIATLGSLTHTFLPTSFTRLRSLYPDVKLQLLEISAADQIAKLAKGQLHLGFVAAPFQVPIKGQHLQSERLLSSPVVVVLNPTHPLSNNNPISLRDLSSDIFIHIRLQRTEGHRIWIESICRKVGIVPHFGPIAESAENLLGMVAAGEGLSLIPKFNERPPSPGYVFRSLADSDVAFELHGVWNPDLPSALRDNFLDIVRAEATKVRESLNADNEERGREIKKPEPKRKRSQRN